MNKFVDFDVKTITASDYTMEFDLHDGIFEEFMKHYYDRTNPLIDVGQFKFYVQQELEQRLTEFPAFGPQDSEDHEIKIAQITFAFENSQVI